MIIGVPIVTCLPRLYQQCTNNVPIVKNSEKQSKDSQNKKMTIGVPIVTCLPSIVIAIGNGNDVSAVDEKENGSQDATLWHSTCQGHAV